jgi:hypothetical protein
MRAALALVLLVVAVGAVLLALHYFPAASGPPSPSRTVPTRPAPQRVQTPVQVVTAYLQALERRDYRKAFDLLSADSRQLHPYDDFVARAEKGGTTDYDVAKAAEEPGEGNSIVVAVPMVEDPAKAGFPLVKEEGVWKVVFIGGSPTFPYAEAGGGQVKNNAGDVPAGGK